MEHALLQRRDWTMRTGTMVVTGGLLLAITCFAAAGQDPCDRGLADKAYVDPKGYFEITPPAGWAVQEFAADPRGKVKWVCQDAPDTMLMIIAQASPHPDFADLVQNERASAARMKAKYGDALTFTDEETEFAGNRAFKGSLVMPGGRLEQRMIVFLVDKNKYALVFGARPDTFKRLLGVASLSLATLRPTPKSVGSKDVAEQLAAGKLRVARNLIQMGQRDYALVIVKEGLAADPANADLLALKKDLEK
jgi:hypothetical protein